MYNYVMTPIIFVSFIVSLAWVDLRYSIQRSQNRSNPGRGWLHHLIYRETSSSASQGNARARSSGGPQDGHYHSKQKKLAKMEMADAFEIRGTVVAVLLMLSASISLGMWVAGSWAWRSFMAEAF